MRTFLASGRRILLGILFGLVLLAGWIYWQAPTLNELRPQLEALLAKQLGLKELRLGHLSWRWAGYVWVDADNITFVGAEKRIQVQDAQLEVRLSGLDLLLGEVRPASVSLRHGRIALHIPKAAAGEAFPLPAGLLHIVDSTVTLTYGAFANRFDHLNLLLDADHRTLGMQLPGCNIDINWNEQLQPVHVQARFDNLLWLPEAWRGSVRGEFAAALQLDKQDGGQDWELKADIGSTAGSRIVDQAGRTLLPLNQVHIKAQIHAGANPLDISSVDWQRIDWQAGDNKLQGHGHWQAGQLQLQLNSPHLNIPVLAGWGIPFADHEWQSWLGGLAGTASDVQASIQLAQATPLALPDLTTLGQRNIRLRATLTDAAIPLTAPGEVLQGVNGDLKLGPSGLDMQASSLSLPFDAGVVHGKMHVADLTRPVFQIDGSGEVDAGLCQQWLNPNALPQVVSQAAPAETTFSLSWTLNASLPDKGEAKLTPRPAWQAEIMGQPVSLSDGMLRWQAGIGMQVRDMQVEYEGLKGRFDLDMRQDPDNTLILTGVKLKSTGDFAALAERLRIPLDGASGSYVARLDYTGDMPKSPWSLHIDLGQAGWHNLLGSKKAIGQAYSLQADGRQSDDNIFIDRIQTHGKAPFISGSGRLTPQLARVELTALQTPAFSGSISLRMPLGEDSKAPLEITINSDFLDHDALPAKLPGMAKFTPASISAHKPKPQRKWVLRGKFKRIRWDAVSARGVQVNFASATHDIGSLQAGALDAAQFSVHNAHAIFRLEADGRMDIRHLDAQLLGQQLNMSGTLQSEPGGGVRWSGFADVGGDFSQVIHRLDASKLFQGGMLHAQWSGTGIIRKDKPWWNAMHGRLRMRSDDGRILEGGTMTKLLAAMSLADLPGFLTGRKDISGPGMLYKRLQLEATVEGETATIRQLAMRASALDMAGKGQLNLADGSIDMYVVARPLQNLDALLNMVPLLRDVIMGPAKSLFRKIYHVHGALNDATVEAASAEQAGLPSAGLLEQLFTLPTRWFDAGKKVTVHALPVRP